MVLALLNAPLSAREIVTDIRARAAAHARDPREIPIFYNPAVVSRTRRESEAKYREYREHASIEGALAHFSSSTGIDFSATSRTSQSVT
jgi:long-chain alkane monooxygenase